jgi:Holliday junction resolvasome RuvABC endonuclease subunit
MSAESIMQMGSVLVSTTDYRGWTVDEIAQRAVDKIVYVGDQSHPALQAQARAYKAQIQHVVTLYMNEAVQQDRATIAQRLREAGHPELVSLLGK